ncbi:MAG: sigma-70 family RNA polymerase sigma factor [Chlorobiaceae bacterium]
MIAVTIPRKFFTLRDLLPFRFNFADIEEGWVTIKRKDASLSDDEMVQLTRKNNKEFSSIIRRYQDALLRYITLSFCDNHTATSLIQEIFVTAYVNLNEYDGSIPFSSWIYRIAHKEIVEKLKEPQYSQEQNCDSSHFEKMVKGIITALPDCEHYTLPQIVYSLKRLQEKRLDIIVLKYSEGKSSQEISDIMELKHEAIKTLMLLAEDDIHQYLFSI